MTAFVPRPRASHDSSVPHPLYDDPDAERLLLHEAPEVPRPDAGWFAAMVAGEPGRGAQPGWTPSRAENHVVLVQLRYAERRAAAGPDADRWAVLAARLRDDAATANLALVVAMVHRYGYGDSFEERLGQAMLAMAQAVRCFDPLRGVAFSTYAGRCIRAAFGKQRFQHARRAAKPAGVVSCPGEEALYADDAARALVAHRAERLAERERDRAEEVAEFVARALSPEERHVLSRRLWAEGRPPSFRTIGREVGLTGERARQMYEGALARLREEHERG